MKRVLVLIAGLMGLLLISASSAGADCSGPTIELADHDVARGGTLRISGTGWGDSCYDTGPPPHGEGVLGVPLGDIEIYIIQGSNEWLVAVGEANRQYAFDITVVVPTTVLPGEATVEARWGSRVSFSLNPQLLVEDAAPSGNGASPVASFGGSPETSTSVATPIISQNSTVQAGVSTSAALGNASSVNRPERGSGLSISAVAIAAAAAMLLLAAGTLAVRSRHRRE